MHQPCQSGDQEAVYIILCILILIKSSILSWNLWLDMYCCHTKMNDAFYSTAVDVKANDCALWSVECVIDSFFRCERRFFKEWLLTCLFGKGWLNFIVLQFFKKQAGSWFLSGCNIFLIILRLADTNARNFS